MKSKISLLLLALLAFACDNAHQNLSDSAYAALSEDDRRKVENALEGIDLMDSDLEVTLFASEPMMRNPTNMDIDDKGRVWIVEGYNYRNELNPRNPYDKKGDRILILEDTDGDGKADKSTVFYQGEDINSALGIGVFGNRVIVSRSPYVFVFTDEDGDDVPDKKEILFEGISGEQHDHGMHAFTFGPDGKFYFNYGNAGESMLTKDGKPIFDKQGVQIKAEGKPYREGMVFRSDIDGSNVEALAWNFRNNFEVTVDSYGRIWQSDNDDDGNRGVRINYVMDYGNYGFKDEMTGSDWRTRRVNLEDSIPLQHWHLNDPGVVPNLLQTYAGSPTGILLYEGKLLPEKYQNQMIHTDAGPNIVRAYPVEKDGAGFKASIANILDGSLRDRWFRPSDLTVAPDGSLFISDWYDPGVGGHAMGDTDRGRIYRVAPKGHGYSITQADYSNTEGNLKALQSPNIATRYIGWVNLNEKGEEAVDALLTLWNGEDARMRARAFWLLSKLPKGKEYILLASQDEDENIRVTAIRAARELDDLDFSEMYLKMASDESPQVRREVAIAIRHQNAPEIWQRLADAYDGTDRWYLEVLGIAAEGNWDKYLTNYLDHIEGSLLDNEKAKDIVWRSRSSRTLDLLGQIIANEPLEKRWRYYRAMDFQVNGDKNSILLQLLGQSEKEEEKVVIFRQLDIENLDEYPKLLSELELVIPEMNDEDYLELVEKFQVQNQKERLISIVRENEDGRNINLAAQIFIENYGITAVKELCFAEDEILAINAIERFGIVDVDEVTDILIEIFKDDNLSLERREMAMEAMNGYGSEARLWDMILNSDVPEVMMDIAQRHMLGTWHSDIRAAANDYFESEQDVMLDVEKLIVKKGDIESGEKVFDMYCLTCHNLNGKGVDFGPGLSQIGAKLSKQGLYNAILFPSEGMGFGYETQLIKLKDGTEFQALLNAKTESTIVVKLLGQEQQSVYDLEEVESISQLNVSLMPKFPLEEEEMVDLVAFLENLK